MMPAYHPRCEVGLMVRIDRRIAIASVLSLAACGAEGGSVAEAGADILLFAGTGTSSNDVTAIRAILSRRTCSSPPSTRRG
jgi:hypothetical protein